MSVDVALVRVLVVDDEPPACDELAYLLGQIPEIGTVRTAADAAGCLRAVEGGQIDAVFLDVRMPGLDGLELTRVLQRMTRPPQVVFVTAFEEYAVEAFGLAAVDYLLKPVRPERLRVAVQRLLTRPRSAAEHAGRTRTGASATHGGDEAEALEDRLAVLSQGRIMLLPVNDIRAVSVEGERVVVLTGHGSFAARQPLAELESRLRGLGFLRVHRAHLVNLHHVVTIETFFNGTYLLKLRDVPDLRIPVSRRHAAHLRAAIRL